MLDVHDLYQEMILDHNKHPRNRRPIDGADRTAEGYNPLCGDRVAVFVKLDGDVVADVAFEGNGCAISTASASLMTQLVKGKTVEEAEALFQRFHGMVTGESPERADDAAALGKLVVFSGVKRYPARVKCATLVWHTIHAALANQSDPVTTE
jgi:nitrogen fixation NifU-like protein